MSGHSGMASVEVSLHVEDMRVHILKFLDEHNAEVKSVVVHKLESLTPEALNAMVDREVDRAVAREIESRVQAEVRRQASARVDELMALHRAST